MAEVPAWLLEMRAITGLTETPGTESNPKILAMAEFIGKTFPDMKSYCDQYRSDATPWCGLCEAYCMARVGIRPPFGKTDTDKFLWARAWADDPNYPKLASPKLGCVVVLSRSGGGHVTTYETDGGSSIRCRGGNQADQINVSSYPKSSVIAYVWPQAVPAPGPEPEPEPTALPTLRKGDTGPSVSYMQSLIPKWIDGDFGSTTDSLLREFQRAKKLIVDGVCGPSTWEALGATEVTPPVKPPTEAGWIHGITATLFGGTADNETSAYPPYDLLNDTDLYVALPDRFEGTRPSVMVRGLSKDVIAPIRDVGPWMTDDPYWASNKRPTAETCYLNKTPLPSGPNKGKIPTNPAGIDLSPGLMNALSIVSHDKVSWRFVI